MYPKLILNNITLEIENFTKKKNWEKINSHATWTWLSYKTKTQAVETALYPSIEANENISFTTTSTIKQERYGQQKEKGWNEDHLPKSITGWANTWIYKHGIIKRRPLYYAISFTQFARVITYPFTSPT